MTAGTYFLVGDDGEPLGMVDMDAVQAAGTLLGYDLAVAADDPAEIDRITAEALRVAGPRAFGYVAAAALRHVVENILDPVLEVAEASGAPLREGLRSAARGAREDLS